MHCMCLSKPPVSTSHLMCLVYQGDTCKTQLETEGTEDSGTDIFVLILNLTFQEKRLKIINISNECNLC